MTPPSPFTIPVAPPTPRAEVVETMHGVPVDDPFRWLEDGASAAVVDWVRAQNTRTRTVLDEMPQRPGVYQRLVALMRSNPFTTSDYRFAGGRLFSFEAWPGRQQPVLVRRDLGHLDEPDLVADPYDLVGANNATLSWYVPSPDGSFIAYGLAPRGDEQTMLRVVVTQSRTLLPDNVVGGRGWSLAWAPDNRGFAYGRLLDDGAEVRWHDLGNDATNDAVLWRTNESGSVGRAELASDDEVVITWVDRDHRASVHAVSRRGGHARVLVRTMSEATAIVALDDDSALALTTVGASRGRVVRIPNGVTDPAEWRQVVGEPAGVLEHVLRTEHSLVIAVRLGPVSYVFRRDRDGSRPHPIALPFSGRITACLYDTENDDVYVELSSFATPPALYRLTGTALERFFPPPLGPRRAPQLVPGPRLAGLLERLADGPVAAEIAGQIAGQNDGQIDGPADDANGPSVGAAGGGSGSEEPLADVDDEVVFDAVRVPSADGTMIPLYLVRAAGTALDPMTPTMLTAYGGFGIASAGTYNRSVALWCSLGGLVAIAAVRGGGELGREWHDAGRRRNQGNSVDDFIAAADWLVGSGYTSRARLVVSGASNGGLLIAAAIARRPDLCRAASCRVPISDMVRFADHRLGALWTHEFGDPADADDFAALYAVSPYHRIVDGLVYPAFLIAAGEEDPRADPMHARKLAARLQAASVGEDRQPILLQSDLLAGHGQGTPGRKRIEDLVDYTAFLLWQVDVEVAPQELPVSRGR